MESETALMVSVVRSSAEEEAVAPPGDVGLQYRISTFDPQAEEVAYGLRQYFGIESEEGSEEGWGVLNPRVLRQAAVFGVLSAVFAGSACGDHENEGFWRKSLRYQKLFHTARSRSRLQIDTDSDQRANTYSSGGTVRLRRV